MDEAIITIKEAHTIENVISKSRFIAHIQPVETEAEAKNFIKSIKSQHHEATHNCSAYTVGDQMNIQKANDDGEPSGTAGAPILNILEKNEPIGIANPIAPLGIFSPSSFPIGLILAEISISSGFISSADSFSDKSLSILFNWFDILFKSASDKLKLPFETEPWMPFFLAQS